MAVQIPFPLPSHGFAQNSKMRVNLDFLVDTFNQFNTGTATWDNVSVGIANNETGKITLYNSSNANYLSIQAGATAANITYTLPVASPLINSVLTSNASAITSWSSSPTLDGLTTGTLGVTGPTTLHSGLRFFNDITGFALSLSNAAGSPASSDLSFSLPTTLGNAGDFLKVDGSGHMSWAAIGSAIALTDLSDVTITSPIISQILTYNGTEWINGNPVPASAGNGIEFFEDSLNIIPTGANNDDVVNSLLRLPDGSPETALGATCNNNKVLIEAHLYNQALNRTVLDAGVWDFDTWCSVDTTAFAGISEVLMNMMRVRPVTPHTVTTTGSGTSRTATASAGTHFATSEIDASATNDVASYLQTLQGLYQITARSSDTVVTIATPSTYANESAVAFSVWKKLFQMATGDIPFITPAYGLINTQVIQSAFTVTLTDTIGILDFGHTTKSHNIVITHAQDGTTHYTHVATPLNTLHNDLAGLQGGTTNQEYHLTLAEHDEVSNRLFTGQFTINPTSNQLVLGGAGSTHTVTVNAGTPTANTTITIPDPLTNANFILDQGTQNIDGLKTFINHVQFAAGSDTTPAINFGDANTGMYWLASHALAITLNGNRSMRFTTTGVSVDLGDLVINSAGHRLQMTGSMSGVLTLGAGDTTNPYTFKFPPDSGTVNYVLRTDGSGTTTWVDLSSVGGANNVLSNLGPGPVAIGVSLNNFTAGTITAALSGHASLDLPLTAGAGAALTGDLYFTNGYRIVMQAPLLGYKIIAIPNDAISWTMTLPSNHGTTGQALIDSNGAGALGWATLPSISGLANTTLSNLTDTVAINKNLNQFSATQITLTGNDPATLLIQSSYSGHFLGEYIDNTSNTANSFASLVTRVAGSSAGDPFFTCTVTGGTSYSFGIDNSDSDKFKISNDITLGSNDLLTITTAGAATFSGLVGIGDTASTYALRVKGGNTNNMCIDNGGQQYTELDFLNNGTIKFNMYWDNVNTNFNMGTGTGLITFTNITKFTNSATGSTTALLATANCPAVTGTAPFVWLKMVAPDGSTIYVPGWK